MDANSEGRRIPRHVVDNHLKGVEALKFYGIPVPDLTREELLAMVNVLSIELRETRTRLYTIPAHLRFGLD